MPPTDEFMSFESLGLAILYFWGSAESVLIYTLFIAIQGWDTLSNSEQAISHTGRSLPRVWSLKTRELIKSIPNA